MTECLLTTLQGIVSRALSRLGDSVSPRRLCGGRRIPTVVAFNSSMEARQ
jgi:hypothetical protein